MPFIDTSGTELQLTDLFIINTNRLNHLWILPSKTKAAGANTTANNETVNDVSQIVVN